MDERELNERPAETLPLHADRPTLRVDEGGAVRVGKSRISLDLVVEETTMPNKAIQPSGICGTEVSPEINVDRAAFPGG